jgi:sugar phosphate isomerase/epimerase
MITRRQFVGGTAALAAAAALPAAAPGWQIGCYTRPWGEFDFGVALDCVAEAGYKYAGIMNHRVVTVQTTPETAAVAGEEVRKRGLETISLYGGDFGVQKSLEAGIEGLKRLIDNCAACRCPNLLLGGTGKATLVEPYYKAVAECCGYAESKRVGLSVKPHGGTNASGAECRKLVESVGHKNFGIWYDPGNIFFYSNGKLDPVDDVASVDGLIAGMSIKDFKPPKEVMVTPGTGLVKFPEVLARARKGGFRRGPLVVECLDRGDRAAITAEARKAREFLERLLK